VAQVGVIDHQDRSDGGTGLGPVPQSFRLGEFV
jgi:hypothetical protein